MFHNVFLNASAGKTRILVTHAIYLLPQVDYIYTVVEGKIAERGTYEELLANDGAFSRFAKEFGAKEEQEEEEEIEEEAVDGDSKQEKSRKRAVASNAPLMQAEERNKGAVSAAVYKRYLKAGKGSIILPLLILSLAFMQGTQVMSSYWLVYWQERLVFILWIAYCITEVFLQKMASSGWLLCEFLMYNHIVAPFNLIYTDGRVWWAGSSTSLRLLLDGSNVRIAHFLCVEGAPSSTCKYILKRTLAQHTFYRLPSEGSCMLLCLSLRQQLVASI